ncbi:MAG TPA: hypothetical protein VEZ47_06635, partial [Gemmatirosa sp.]|nr:hypothetical protein [Gemmatirosa sp.]
APRPRAGGARRARTAAPRENPRAEGVAVVAAPEAMAEVSAPAPAPPAPEPVVAAATPVPTDVGTGAPAADDAGLGTIADAGAQPGRGPSGDGRGVGGAVIRGGAVGDDDMCERHDRANRRGRWGRIIGQVLVDRGGAMTSGRGGGWSGAMVSGAVLGGPARGLPMTREAQGGWRAFSQGGPARRF